jgi:hypothetical protein
MRFADAAHKGDAEASARAAPAAATISLKVIIESGSGAAGGRMSTRRSPSARSTTHRARRATAALPAVLAHHRYKLVALYRRQHHSSHA